MLAFAFLILTNILLEVIAALREIFILLFFRSKKPKTAQLKKAEIKAKPRALMKKKKRVLNRKKSSYAGEAFSNLKTKNKMSKKALPFKRLQEQQEEIKDTVNSSKSIVVRRKRKKTVVSMSRSKLRSMRKHNTSAFGQVPIRFASPQNIQRMKRTRKASAHSRDSVDDDLLGPKISKNNYMVSRFSPEGRRKRKMTTKKLTVKGINSPARSNRRGVTLNLNRLNSADNVGQRNGHSTKKTGVSGFKLKMMKIDEGGPASV